MNETSIPCPVCKTSITISFQLLLNGAKFCCKGCETEVSLGDQSNKKKDLKKTKDFKK